MQIFNLLLLLLLLIAIEITSASAWASAADSASFSRTSMTTSKPTSPMVGGKNYRFTVLADGLLRYEWAPDGVFEDRPSFFAAARNATRPVPQFVTRESDHQLEIITERFHLTYDKREFTPYGLFVVIIGYTGTTWRYGETHETLGGTVKTLDNINGRIALEPGVTSKLGFAPLRDDSFLFTDDGFVAPRRPGKDRVDGYLFCYGHEYRKAVQALYDISGPPPPLPRYALGNFWSRYYNYSAQSYLELMDSFRKYHIPLSVAVVDMDWHLVDDERVRKYRGTGWTGYTWDRKLFPDPPAFIQELHKRKLKLTLNDHPADGVQPYEDQYPAVARKMGVDPASEQGIPFDISDRVFLEAYFDPLLQSLRDDGVDFWWVDWQQGTQSRLPGVDPLPMLNHFHYAKWRGSGRPVMLSRYAGPGAHRYPIGFSGDTIVSWDSLRFQPEFTATASNIGFGSWSHDIGGHMFGGRDDDLTTRWIQFGVFSPVFRLHSSKTRWVCKEPWKLPAGSGRGPREVVISFMQLRHRMIPYLHTMNARAANRRGGEPLIQPLYWNHPERDEAYQFPNEYFFGSEMLVAPITDPTSRESTHLGSTRAWLPPGRYVDFFSGAVYDGDRTLWLSRTLDKMPVFLREGAIVPLDGRAEPENGAERPTKMEVVVVVGADGRFELLEEADDDGKEKGGEVDWIKTPIAFDQESGTVTIDAVVGSHPTKTLRGWSIRLVGFKAADKDSIKATVDGRSYTPTVETTETGLVIRLDDASPLSPLTVNVGRPKPQLAVTEPMALLEPVLYEAEVAYTLKEKIEASFGLATRAERASQIEALDMEDGLRRFILELLFADSRG
ncbi:Glycoside hydrolase, family 31 [Ophiocordyceps camponoti-floridani]|uniref:alpha-glucosidase n=1 Tax=Ophiocordyceps camponoti-floridani TaxID=2030778 RepID=A0A8H4Q0L8_9HYPO|nr:Glycoside hydrolase, family 31 [Ophiocordyceps camponoti-floridani]